jgi:hypothetical protein
MSERCILKRREIKGERGGFKVVKLKLSFDYHSISLE